MLYPCVKDKNINRQGLTRMLEYEEELLVYNTWEGKIKPGYTCKYSYKLFKNPIRGKVAARGGNQRRISTPAIDSCIISNRIQADFCRD